MQDNIRKALFIGGFFLVGFSSLYLLTKRLRKKSNSKHAESPEQKMMEDLSIFSTPEKKEKDDAFNIEFSDEKLEELFQQACNQVSSITEISDKQKLKLYAYYKQANEGDCTKSKPPMSSLVNYMKWESWKKVSGMQKNEAKKHYIGIISTLTSKVEDNSQEFDETLENDSSEKTNGLGLKVSKISKNEEHDRVFANENKQDEAIIAQVFNAVLLEDIAQLKMLIESGYNLLEVNGAGVSPFHYAIDNSKINSFNFLLGYFLGEKINLKDLTGFTPLHYAVLVNDMDIMEILLNNGANPYIKDKDGSDCWEMANEEQKKVMRKYYPGKE